MQRKKDGLSQGKRDNEDGLTDTTACPQISHLCSVDKAPQISFR